MSLVAVEPNWVCNACAFSNLERDIACHMCGSNRNFSAFAVDGQIGHSRGKLFTFPGTPLPHDHVGRYTPMDSMWGQHHFNSVTANIEGLHTIHPNKSQVSTPARRTNGHVPGKMNGKKHTPSGGMPIPNGHHHHGLHQQSLAHPHDSEGSTSPPHHSTTATTHHGSPSGPNHLANADGDAQQKRDPRLGQNADEDERRATEEGRKVFVGNLKRPITRQEVVDHFSKFGEVERVILNSGFGLVLMATREGALKATEQRWQALDWRNVEVFVYTKGAKGASWNRPYAVPPKPGPCSLCNQESAEHCALCTSALCLNDKSNSCTSCCRTCQRSFCRAGKECGLKDGLDSCDYCGALTCLFCALRLEAVCAQCNRPFSERIQENARQRAVRMVNSRISENDGSVYALVCLLKGDMESSREGQLVAAIDRASKLFDPKASSWCTLTALRAIKELDEAWEATRRVHNLRALRRSAKQWSTDLGGLTIPANPMGAPVQAPVQAPMQRGQSSFLAPPAGFVPAPFNHVQNFVQQQQQISMSSMNALSSMALANTSGDNSASRNEELLFAALRSSETFLLDFEPKTKMETDWLVSNLRNVALSATKKRTVFVEELCMRMDVWAVLLRKIPPGSVPVPATVANMTPLNALKRAIADLDLFYINCKAKEDFLAKKDGYLGEMLRAARELKRTSPIFSSSELLLRRAGRSARNCETRAMLVSQNIIPFDACIHYFRYRRCSLTSPATSYTAQCPFSHNTPMSNVMSEVDQREFDAADYEFSNESDEISLAVASTIARQLPISAVNQPMALPVAQAPPVNSNPWTLAASPSGLWSGTAPALFLPPSSQSVATTGASSKGGYKDKFMDWNSAPDQLIAIPQEPMGSNVDFLAVQVASLCQELNIEGSQAHITAAFLASGAAHHVRIWDTDVALLHKELVKIPSLPAATRVRIINLVTERRQDLTQLPGIASILVPELL